MKSCITTVHIYIYEFVRSKVTSVFVFPRDGTRDRPAADAMFCKPISALIFFSISMNEANGCFSFSVNSSSVFRHLMELDADSFWFALNEIFCPVSYEPPHPHLRPVTLSGSDKPRNEFTDNILKLLQEFDPPLEKTRDERDLEDIRVS